MLKVYTTTETKKLLGLTSPSSSPPFSGAVSMTAATGASCSFKLELFTFGITVKTKAGSKTESKGQENKENISAHLLKLAIDLLSKRCERSGRLFVVHRRWCWLVVGRLLGDRS